MRPFDQVFEIGGIKLQPQPEWADVTRELQDENAPFTLAKPEGLGVLQISTATPKGGQSSRITLMDLQALLDEYCASHDFAKNLDSELAEKGGTLVAAQSTRDQEAFYRIWYWSDGEQVVLATYNCANDPTQAELDECELMIKSFTAR